ncbi:hypothetical protein ACMC9I_00230 [Deinococcota bacterium DY0809b]
MTPEPRRAGPDDAAAVLRVLVAAFMGDPVMVWFDPGAGAREPPGKR